MCLHPGVQCNQCHGGYKANNDHRQRSVCDVRVPALPTHAIKRAVPVRAITHAAECAAVPGCTGVHLSCGIDDACLLVVAR